MNFKSIGKPNDSCYGLWSKEGMEDAVLKMENKEEVMLFNVTHPRDMGYIAYENGVFIKKK